MLEFLVDSRNADPAPATWNAAVREVADVLRSERGTDVEVVAHLHLYEGTVVASRQRMSAIVMNLAFNAIDAMPNGGELSIHTYETETHSCLEVRDTGTGIPPQVTAHIFEPAFTTKGERGTGLGLFAVKRFVDEARRENQRAVGPGRGDEGAPSAFRSWASRSKSPSRPGASTRAPL